MVFRLERERETKVRGGEGRELRNILFSNGDINWALGPHRHTLYISTPTQRKILKSKHTFPSTHTPTNTNIYINFCWNPFPICQARRQTL